MKSHLLLLLPQFIFFIFQAILQCTPLEVAALDANADREVLVSFKQAIFDPDNALSGWNLSSSHCTWLGVSCTTTGNRVRSLRLTSLGLTGPLSPHLANLTFLQVLNLTNNSFYGPIPFQLGQLSLLRYLSLSGNFYLNGTIPASLSQCYRLKHLSLDFNDLSGSIPSELGNLSRLKVLDAAGNYLLGVVPASLGNLTSLSLLNLGRNQLSGEIPTQLGRLSMLHTLYLCENNLTGEIPSSIYNLSSLAVLSLVENNLVGELPPSMGLKLLNLKELYLGANKLEGFIPPSLSNATQLQILDLSTNGFRGTIPSLGSLNRLATLHLGNNNLSSNTELNRHLFASLANCTQLEVIILNSNQLAGELPSSFANLSAHLQHFCFNDNDLSGSFPKGLEKFRNLNVISLVNNRFTGEVPNLISVLNKLVKIEIQGNMFSGEIPDVFGNLTQLFLLEMTNNHFSGQIPLSIGLCEHLQTLGLARNKLKGSIPKQIFGLRSLISLDLAQNSLLGSLPCEIGGMEQLEFMNVSDNKLSGHLPSTIGGCSSLRHLIVARNKFTGLIPKSIENLAGIERLDLSSNNFSGPIPEELGKFRYLQSLNLSFNDLEGEIPRHGAFLSLDWDTLQGNHKLCVCKQMLSRRWRVPLCEEKKESNHSLLKTVIVILSSMVLTCAILCLIWRLIVRIKKKKEEEAITSLPPLKWLIPKISYNDIQLATNGFAAENLIGEGSFGSVYRGVFRANDSNIKATYAVKVLDLHQTKAVKSFDAECEALKNVRHRNLVKVISSCSSIDRNGGEFKALVMEFMPNGSLDKWLHPKDTESRAYLSLSQRLDVAIDVASAMDYLHHDCEPPVVHCDLKPANVLLDEQMGAHVGDFGLARFLSPTSPQKESSTIGLKGSIGYIPPEYGVGSRAWPSGDVYSFGILLLEMFTAKKPTDEMFKEGLDLKKFASAADETQVFGIADARLYEMSSELSEDGTDSGSHCSSNCNSSWQSRSEECIAAVISVGLSCADDSACNRLTMRETLAKLKEIKERHMGQ